MPLTGSLIGRPYRVAGVARPLRGISDDTWRSTQLRLAELGIFAGQIVEKAGSAGPGCSTILKVGGSRAAVSPDLCSLILVRAVSS